MPSSMPPKLFDVAERSGNDDGPCLTVPKSGFKESYSIRKNTYQNGVKIEEKEKVKAFLLHNVGKW